MKKIYMAQPTFMNTSSVYLPYAVGALASYAWSFEEIRNNYEFSKCFFLRESPDEVLKKIETPFLVGFSCYMWNFEYNKVLAKKIKEKYPECIIVFGGQNISPDSSELNLYSYIDILIQGEGEVAFKDLLISFLNNTPLKDVSNISFRNGSSIVCNPVTYPEKLDFPSPYQTGFFDRIMDEYPNIDFIPLVETNRGCPNKCSYCSWGQQKAKVRLFPMERVLFDIEWVSKRKMEFLGFADANFGIIARDEEIVDRIIDLKETNGFPKKFQVSYSKDSASRVYRITKKLNRYKMDKGVTLSFQSMSQDVQNNIGRSNMYINTYIELLKKYAEDSIPTYTDLILGLPGETLDSFTDGFEKLLECGQHTSLFVHLCEWLPRAEMGSKDYMEKYGIKYKRVPLNQPHSSLDKNDCIQEYSKLITQTNTMSEDDWINMNLISTAVLCFHHLGILQLIALYLYDRCGLRYTEFYSELLEYLISTEKLKCSTFKTIKNKICRVVSNCESAVIFDERFGNIAWPFEEYAFLDIISHYQDFFDDIKSFLNRYINEDILDDILNYQIFVLKKPETGVKYYYGKHNWKDYFDLLIKNRKAVLLEKDVKYIIRDETAPYSLPDYAKKVLWFGRRGGKNIYTSEIEEIE